MYGRTTVPIVRARSRVNIEAMAQCFLDLVVPHCLQEPQPVPMVEIFDQILPRELGFSPHIRQLTPGLGGYTHCAEKTVTLDVDVYAGLEEGDGRSRFTAAHEVGHVVLHAEELAPSGALLVNGLPKPVLARRSELKPYLDPEWQADCFAAALLMPEPLVRRIVRKGPGYPTTAMTLMRVFAVSHEAAKKRIEKLGLQ